MKLRIGSRGSQLALWQANHIAGLLRMQGHDVEIEIIKTTGDRLQEVTFAQVGSKGMFTKEIEEALAEGRVKAQDEFESALRQARQPLANIKSFISQHPELRSPMYKVTRRPGVISTAANFVLDVDDLMRRSGGPGSISCPDPLPGALEGQPNTLRQEA